MIFAAGAFAFSWSSLQAILEPEMLNYSEGIVAHGAERVWMGQPLWGDLAAPPYRYHAYPPMFALLGAALAAVAGHSMAVLRALTAVSYAVAMVFAGRIAARASGAAWAGWCAAGVGLLVASGHPFTALVRVDPLEVAFGMVALDALCQLGGDSPRRVPITFLAALAVAACALTKWTGLAPFGGVLLYRVVHTRSLRDPVVVALLLGFAGTGVGFGVAHLLSDGASTHQLFLAQAQSGWILRAFVVLNYLGYHPLLVLLAAWAAWSRRVPVATAALVSSVLWVSFAQLKDGADHNYGLWPIALTVAVAGAGLRPWVAWVSQRRSATLAGWSLLALAAVSGLIATQQTNHLERRGPHWRADHAALASQMRALPSGTSPLVEEPFYARRHGLRPWLVDPSHINVMSRRGRLDLAPLMNAMRSGEIPWVLRGDVLGGIPGINAVLSTHYEPVFQTRGPMVTGRLTLYRFLERDAPARPTGPEGEPSSRTQW